MVVSIDIGTSYSSICLLGPEGKTLPVDIGTGTSMYGSKYSLPTAVFVDESGNVLVGQAAMNSRKRAPQNFRMEFKRDFGQDVPIILGSRKFLPKDLYTEMFRHMAQKAVQSGGKAIERAYVTYPASFGKKKKAQIIEAANAAGLFEVELVDEPTAAAMSYVQAGLADVEQMHGGGEQIFLVYDFGGGTFDASLIGYCQGRFYSLAEPVGLEHCGGIDIDRRIYADMLGHVDLDMLALVNKTPVNRMRLDGQLAELAIKAKHHLSAATDFYEDIQVGFDLVPYHLSVDKLNAMISPLVGQTIESCRRILKAAGLTTSQLSAILMVGGTSRVPLVQSFVRQFAGGVEVLSTVDLELAVAQGALGFHKVAAAKPDVQKLLDNASVVSEDIRILSGKSSAGEAEAAKKSRPGVDSKDRASEAQVDTPEVGVALKQKTVPQIILRPGSSVLLQRSGTVIPHTKDTSVNREIQDWKDIVDIQGGNYYKPIYIGLKKNGTVVVAGDDNIHKLSYSLSDWRDITEIAFSAGCIMGIRKDGSVVSAGSHSGYLWRFIDWQDMRHITYGVDHVVGLRTDGTVAATGGYFSGQCNVERWRAIVSISCGDYHTVGLKKDGTVVATGKYGDGRCNVDDWTEVSRIACGNEHTVGLKKDGTVVATGNNDWGQCNVSGWDGVTSIVCGNYHTVGLKNNGTVVATGWNEYGQCDVKDWKDIVAVFCGPINTAGFRKDGAILVNSYTEKKRTVSKQRLFGLLSDKTEVITEILNKKTKEFDVKWL